MKKQITKKHPEGFIRISVSTEKKYFSITADLCIDQRFSDGGIFACGCLHDEILQVCPELKLFVDLHLSDLDGVPMHAEENGWYWLAKAAGIPQKYEPRNSDLDCFAFFMKHSRMSGPEAQELIGKILQAYQKGKNSVALSEQVSPRTMEEQQKVGAAKAREVWGKALDGLRPRWKSEADEALKLLESL